MPTFHDYVIEVMNLAHEFSPRTNRAMQRRKEVLKEMAMIGKTWINDLRPELVSDLDLDAEGGGQLAT